MVSTERRRSAVALGRSVAIAEQVSLAFRPPARISLEYIIWYSIVVRVRAVQLVALAGHPPSATFRGTEKLQDNRQNLQCSPNKSVLRR